MEILCFIFIIFLTQTNSQIKENPIFITNNKYPFVLSSTDNYYYVLTLSKGYKIDKENGTIIDEKSNIIPFPNVIYITDNSNNNFFYLFYSKEYYHITYDPFISYEKIEFPCVSKYGSGKYPMTNVGTIPQDNDFIIYGYYSNYLIFSSKTQEYRSSHQINNLDKKMSCKFIGDQNFICAMNINSKLNLYFLKYQIDPNYSRNNNLTLCYILNDIYEIENSIVTLFDTQIIEEKFLCFVLERITCQLIRVSIKDGIGQKTNLTTDYLYFQSDTLSENTCYSSYFNSEYLFCCAIDYNIKCCRISSSTYKIIKYFSISISRFNSYLTIKANNNFVTFFFMNKFMGNDKVYEYYIYLPNCEHREYTLFHSLNEDRTEDNREKLSNLFTVETNKYFFELKETPEEYGYFTLNNIQVNGRTLIDNNDYILDFIVIKKEINRKPNN